MRANSNASVAILAELGTPVVRTSARTFLGRLLFGLREDIEMADPIWVDSTVIGYVAGETFHGCGIRDNRPSFFARPCV